MNKEELLQKTRNEVAKKEYGCRNWTTLYRKYIEEKPDLIILAMEIAMQRYAIAMCEKQKKECAESLDENRVFYNHIEVMEQECKQSIHNTKNVAE